MLDTHLTDPDRAIRHSSALRTVADTIEDMNRRLDLRVEAMHFHGAAADRLRANMDERSRRAARIAHRLHELAERASAGC
jgi:hypothetical protein